jgi:hypothetical protein
MKTSQPFLIDQLEIMISTSRQIIEKSRNLQAKAIEQEKYINAEGYRVSISIHEDMIHKMTRVVSGLPAFQPETKGGLTCAR